MAQYGSRGGPQRAINQFGEPVQQQEVQPVTGNALDEAIAMLTQRAKIPPEVQAQKMADVYRQNAKVPRTYGSQQGPTSMLSDKGLQFQPIDHSAFLRSVAADNMGVSAGIGQGVGAAGDAGRNLATLLGHGVAREGNQLAANTSRYGVDQNTGLGREQLAALIANQGEVNKLTGRGIDVEEAAGKSRDEILMKQVIGNQSLAEKTLAEKVRQYDTLSAADERKLSNADREMIANDRFRLATLQESMAAREQQNEQFKASQAYREVVGNANIENEKGQLKAQTDILNSNKDYRTKQLMLDKLKIEIGAAQGSRDSLLKQLELTQRGNQFNQQQGLAEREFETNKQQGNDTIDLNYRLGGFAPPSNPGEPVSRQNYEPAPMDIGKARDPGLLADILQKSAVEPGLFEKLTDFSPKPGIGLGREIVPERVEPGTFPARTTRYGEYNPAYAKAQRSLIRQADALQKLLTQQGGDFSQEQVVEAEQLLNQQQTGNADMSRAMRDERAPEIIRNILQRAAQR